MTSKYPDLLEAKILRQTLVILSVLAFAAFTLLVAENCFFNGHAPLQTLDDYVILLGALLNAVSLVYFLRVAPDVRRLRRAGTALIIVDFAFHAVNTLVFSYSVVAIAFAFIGMTVFVVILGLVSRNLPLQASAAVVVAVTYAIFFFLMMPIRNPPVYPVNQGALRVAIWGAITLGSILTAILAYAAQEGYLVSYFRRLTYYDHETGYPNGKMLEIDLARKIATAKKGRRLALFIIRLDGIGELVGMSGHEAATRWFERMFVVFADSLEEWQRSCPEIGVSGYSRVYRAEIDLFYLLFEIPESVTDIGACALKLERRLRGDLLRQESDFGSGFYSAYSIFPDDAETADQLRGNAYRTMARLESGDRNRIVPFNATQHGRYIRESAIRSALLKPEFPLSLGVVFQPKIEVSTGVCSGFEILVRWKHPEFGAVSPSEFIPIAEETPAIEAITGFVVRETVAFVRRLNELPGGNLVRVSFNLSPRLVTVPFLTSLADRLRDLPESRQLEIEITEGVILRENDAIRAIFQRFRELGVHFSIDDFGTGYSNLSYLQGFRPDALKIDRRFVGNLPGDEDNANLVRAMLSLARTFSMRAIVEGVETRGQVDFLSTIGCDEIQGFYFSRPVPAEDALAFFSVHTPAPTG